MIWMAAIPCGWPPCCIEERPWATSPPRTRSRACAASSLIPVPISPPRSRPHSKWISWDSPTSSMASSTPTTSGAPSPLRSSTTSCVRAPRPRPRRSRSVSTSSSSPNAPKRARPRCICASRARSPQATTPPAMRPSRCAPIIPISSSTWWTTRCPARAASCSPWRPCVSARPV